MNASSGTQTVTIVFAFAFRIPIINWATRASCWPRYDPMNGLTKRSIQVSQCVPVLRRTNLPLNNISTCKRV